jgi:toxic protein SymE
MKRLTVSRLFRSLRWKEQFVPFIRISGKWLEEAGFRPGTYVTVRVENGSLIITPAKDWEAES